MQSCSKAYFTMTVHHVTILHAANGAVGTHVMSQPPPLPHHAPKQDQEDNASGLSRGNSSASSHAPNGIGLPAECTNGYMPMLYSSGPGAQQQPNLASSFTPLPDKVCSPLCNANTCCVWSHCPLLAFLGGALVNVLVSEPAPVIARASALALEYS